jgi:hypothetical protein
MQRGADPASPEVQDLARQWRVLVHAFTGGDAGIAQGVMTMYRSEPDAGARYGLDPAIFEYIGRAYAAAGAT